MPVDGRELPAPGAIDEGDIAMADRAGSDADKDFSRSGGADSHVLDVKPGPELPAHSSSHGTPGHYGTRYRRMASSSRTIPSTGWRLPTRYPSGSTPTGSASMKSRRSGVQLGGSNGYSRYGPPPTPAHRWRFASRPMPLVHVCGLNRRPCASTCSASVRAREMPTASTASGW